MSTATTSPASVAEKITLQASGVSGNPAPTVALSVNVTPGFVLKIKRGAAPWAAVSGALSAPAGQSLHLGLFTAQGKLVADFKPLTMQHWTSAVTFATHGGQLKITRAQNGHLTLTAIFLQPAYVTNAPGTYLEYLGGDHKWHSLQNASQWARGTTVSMRIVAGPTPGGKVLATFAPFAWGSAHPSLAPAKGAGYVLATDLYGHINAVNVGVGGVHVPSDSRFVRFTTQEIGKSEMLTATANDPLVRFNLQVGGQLRDKWNAFFGKYYAGNLAKAPFPSIKSAPVRAPELLPYTLEVLKEIKAGQSLAAVTAYLKSHPESAGRINQVINDALALLGCSNQQVKDVMNELVVLYKSKSNDPKINELQNLLKEMLYFRMKFEGAKPESLFATARKVFAESKQPLPDPGHPDSAVPSVATFFQCLHAISGQDVLREKLIGINFYSSNLYPNRYYVINHGILGYETVQSKDSSGYSYVFQHAAGNPKGKPIDTTVAEAVSKYLGPNGPGAHLIDSTTATLDPGTLKDTASGDSTTLVHALTGSTTKTTQVSGGRLVSDSELTAAEIAKFNAVMASTPGTAPPSHSIFGSLFSDIYNGTSTIVSKINKLVADPAIFRKDALAAQKTDADKVKYLTGVSRKVLADTAPDLSSATDEANYQQRSASSNKGVVIGLGVGGAAMAAVVIALIIYCVKRRLPQQPPAGPLINAGIQMGWAANAMGGGNAPAEDGATWRIGAGNMLQEYLDGLANPANGQRRRSNASTGHGAIPIGMLDPKGPTVTGLTKLTVETLGPIVESIADLYAQPTPPDANTAAYWGNLLGFLMQNPPMAREVATAARAVNGHGAAVRAAVVKKVNALLAARQQGSTGGGTTTT